MPKADIKTKKFCGIYVVNLSEGNFRNPFGVRRAPSEPVSVFSVVKNPASKSHFINHNKMPHLSNFLSLFSKGDSPPKLFIIPTSFLTAKFVLTS